MKKFKDLLEKINKYPKEEIIYSSKYYDLLIDLMDCFWSIRKNYKYGDKIFGIIFYHDFLSAAVNARMHCYYIEGKFDKYKDNKKIFPDWNVFIEGLKKGIVDYQQILNDGIENLNKFNELEYLPAFNGFYRKQYFRFIVNLSRP